MLKQISKYIAFERGYKINAEEVRLYSNNKLGEKYIADLVGIKMNAFHERNNKIITPKIDVICIEAKQSRQDYFNGFVSSADYNYVITPKGMLDKSELLDNVGLIEVDFNAQIFDRSMRTTQGIITVKRATRNKNVKVNKLDLIRQIGKRNTVENMFVRHGINQNKL